MITSKNLKPYAMLTPSVILFLIFFIYPIFYMIYLSFTSWNLISPVIDFVGLENYYELFSDRDFLQVLLNTTLYTVLTVVLSIVIALILSLWLNRPGTLFGVVQGAIFSPYIISLVSVSLLWLWMMDPQYGLLNTILESFGLPQSKWLSHTDSSLLSLVLVGVWKTVGYNTLVFISGLQSIPKSIFEAASLEPVSKMKIFYKITLPLLSPSFFFLFVVNTIASFQVFDTVQIMTQGGPVNSTNMLVFYIYEYGFNFFKIGYASAAGVVLLLIVGIMTIFHFLLMARRIHYR